MIAPMPPPLISRDRVVVTGPIKAREIMRRVRLQATASFTVARAFRRVASAA